MTTISFPSKYVPEQLTNDDTKKQLQMLIKSKKMYKDKKYYIRKKVKSYKNKPSSHISNAKKMYNIDSIFPSNELSVKTGCSIDALKQIVSKGEGAYYSSGSRPNQTPQSWGIARLASSITGGKAAAVDFNIIDKYCDITKQAHILALKSKEKYNNGRSKTKRKIFNYKFIK